MNLDEVLNYRRSVRVYDKEKEIDIEKSKALPGIGNFGSQ